jgi:hypothetical protein
MSRIDSAYESAGPKDEADKARETIYRVVLEGIKAEIETLDSFSIKYGILTSTPVTRIKFMMRNLPKTIVETKSVAKARSALELIEEAGGIGLIEEYDPEIEPKVEISEEQPAKVSADEQTCINCGFPLKRGDEYCQFCHTPLQENKGHKIKGAMKAGGGGQLVSPVRLLIYIAVMLLVIVISALMS